MPSPNRFTMESHTETGATSNRPYEAWLKLLFANAVHVVGLMLPTWFLFGFQWTTELICFSLIIGFAGLLESVLVQSTRSIKYRPPSANNDRPIQMATWVGISILTFFWSSQIEYALLNVPKENFPSLALLVAVLGVGLRLWAIHELKDRFVSDICVVSKPAVTGPYRWTRHPGELGMLLFVLASISMLGSWRTLVAAIACLVPISLWRVDLEDRHIVGR